MDLQGGWRERENASVEIHCVLTQVGSGTMHGDGTWAKARLARRQLGPGQVVRMTRSFESKYGCLVGHWHLCSWEGQWVGCQEAGDGGPWDSYRWLLALEALSGCDCAVAHGQDCFLWARDKQEGFKQGPD